MTEPWPSDDRPVVTESPTWVTVAGGKHSATQVQRAGDEQPVPGAGSFALLGLAVIATMVGLGVEFNALPVPHAVDALWIPLLCVPVALLAGFAGVRLRWRRAVDTGVGLGACVLFMLGSAVATARVDARYGIYAFVLGALVIGMMALERSFSAGRTPQPVPEP